MDVEHRWCNERDGYAQCVYEDLSLLHGSVEDRSSASFHNDVKRLAEPCSAHNSTTYGWSSDCLSVNGWGCKQAGWLQRSQKRSSWVYGFYNPWSWNAEEEWKLLSLRSLISIYADALQDRNDWDCGTDRYTTIKVLLMVGMRTVREAKSAKPWDAVDVWLRWFSTSLGLKERNGRRLWVWMNCGRHLYNGRGCIVQVEQNRFEHRKTKRCSTSCLWRG